MTDGDDPSRTGGGSTGSPPDSSGTPRVLGGRYEVDGLLGHGGMAEVYRGTDRVLGRPVAVKVLGRQFSRDNTFVARFRREAQAAAALNHPNVVSVFDTGSDDGTHFIVMEYVQGKTLAQVIREDAPLLPERAVEIAAAVAHALGFAHRAGIVHRDVKPGNIMLTPTGDVKVMDFGIARATTSESLTQTATVLGTATYFSPEQAQGQPVDARSDIYSLGCVLYEMLTAHPPFMGDTPVAVAFKHVKEDPARPSSRNRDVSPELDAIVLKCLAKNPANRYQNAEALATDLQRFHQGLPIHATPLLGPDSTEVIRRTEHATSVIPVAAPVPSDVYRRRRWVAVAVVLGVLLLLGVGLFLLARSLSSPSKTVPNVIGKPLPLAEQTLRNAGFNIGTVRRVASPQQVDTVLDYTPKSAKPGTSIDLTVSNGGVASNETVPNVVCESRFNATSDLIAAGFKVRIGAPATSTQCLPGTVGSQDPPGNTQAAKGSAVIIHLVPQPSPSPTTPSPSPTTPSPPPTTPSPPPTTPSPTGSASSSPPAGRP